MSYTSNINAYNAIYSHSYEQKNEFVDDLYNEMLPYVAPRDQYRLKSLCKQLVKSTDINKSMSAYKQIKRLAGSISSRNLTHTVIRSPNHYNTYEHRFNLKLYGQVNLIISKVTVCNIAIKEPINSPSLNFNKEHIKNIFRELEKYVYPTDRQILLNNINILVNSDSQVSTSKAFHTIRRYIDKCGIVNSKNMLYRKIMLSNQGYKKEAYQYYLITSKNRHIKIGTATFEG